MDPRKTSLNKKEELEDGVKEKRRRILKKETFILKGFSSERRRFGPSSFGSSLKKYF